jgi:hypothetical protein
MLLKEKVHPWPPRRIWPQVGEDVVGDMILYEVILNEKPDKQRVKLRIGRPSDDNFHTFVYSHHQMYPIRSDYLRVLYDILQAQKGKTLREIGDARWPEP